MPHLPCSREILSSAEEAGFRPHRAAFSNTLGLRPAKKPGFARYVAKPGFVAGVTAIAAAAMLSASPAMPQTAAGRGPSDAVSPQAPAPPASPGAPGQSGPTDVSAASLETHIRNLASIDYPTRMNAARMVRRVDAAAAVAALREAVAKHPDEFVRYRAFILLSSFNDRQTGAVVRTLLTDRNDRLREAAYKWLEMHPDPSMTATLLAALQTEVAEFVRPALVGALAALGTNVQVQRALIPEVTRGVDFFRAAAIDSLGRHRATYAVEAIAGVSALEGPLRDDAVLALGRIGGPQARAALAAITSPPPALVPTLRAAVCLAAEERGGVPAAPCDAIVKMLLETVSAPNVTTGIVRATVTGLSAIAASGNYAATGALLTLASRGGGLRDESALGFAATAVRNPGHMLAWLTAAPEPTRGVAVDLLKQGFEDLEEDFGEEQFFAEARAYYWKVPDGSSGRTLAASLIQKLEF
jgi:HEAT repeat protein